MWDGDVIAGPVPTMFADDAEAAAANLLKEVRKTHGDLQRFSRLFGVVEHMDIDKAVALLKKPRYKFFHKE